MSFNNAHLNDNAWLERPSEKLEVKYLKKMKEIALGLALCMTASLAWGQGALLPPELDANFTSNNAILLFPGVPSTPTSHLSAFANFDTSEKLVKMSWQFEQVGASGVATESHTVSYSPTAICKQQGIGPVFYIAGYIQRTGQVVVEQWTVHPLLTTAQPENGGEPTIFLSNTVTKEVVIVSSAIKPLRAILYHFTQSLLWLIEDGPPNNVWAVDPVVGSPQLVFNSTAISVLPDLLSAQTFLIKPTAPDGGGFLLVFYRWRAWAPQWDTTEIQPPLDTVYVMRDIDLDGVIDESALISWSEYGARNYDAYMNAYYQ